MTLWLGCSGTIWDPNVHKAAAAQEAAGGLRPYVGSADRRRVKARGQSASTRDAAVLLEDTWQIEREGEGKNEREDARSPVPGRHFQGCLVRGRILGSGMRRITGGKHPCTAVGCPPEALDVAQAEPVGQLHSALVAAALRQALSAEPQFRCISTRPPLCHPWILALVRPASQHSRSLLFRVRIKCNIKRQRQGRTPTLRASCAAL